MELTLLRPKRLGEEQWGGGAEVSGGTGEWIKDLVLDMLHLRHQSDNEVQVSRR